MRRYGTYPPPPMAYRDPSYRDPAMTFFDPAYRDPGYRNPASTYRDDPDPARRPPKLLPLSLTDHLGNLSATMEIGNHLGGAFSRKDPALMSSLLYMPPMAPGAPIDPELQSQMVNLEKHYQIQSDMLSQQFDQQRHILAQEQAKMQEYFKMMMAHKQQQSLLQQQHQQNLADVAAAAAAATASTLDNDRRETHKLDQIKHKTRDEESAIASNEVKQKLRECLLSKGQVKNSPPEFRQWATHHSSLEQHSPPTSGLSPPLRGAHMIGRFQDENALRRTASEPNLKVRLALKQKMIERRSSPLLRRKDRLGLLAAKRNNTPITIDAALCNSNPDSGPNSPPTASASSSQNSSTETAPKDEPSAPLKMMSNMVINQSMPNISIGQPRDKMAKQEPQSLSLSASEAELRARAAAQYGLPLLGSYQYYPMAQPGTVVEGEMSPPSGGLGEQPLGALEAARSSGAMATGSIPPALINTMSLPESSQPHIQQRPPLHRTNSAPLPLPGQLLWNQHQMMLHKQQEQLLKESQKNYLKQKLQSTLLQRSSSKGQMENVDESAENRLVADGNKDVVVIDDQKAEVTASPPRATRRERESFLLKMRQPAISGGSPPIIPEKDGEQSPSSDGSDMNGSSFGGKSATGNAISGQNYGSNTAGTTVAYDLLMLRHTCICGNNALHPENPDRLQSIISRLEASGLLQRCEKMKSRKATPEELKTCHSEAYVHMYSTNPHKLDRAVFDTFFPRFCKLACGGIGVDSDTVWNELYTPQAVRTATGCVIDLAFKVARGDTRNGFALVRPPGHHAEDQQAMGFCFFNSIAVATKLLLDRLSMKRILIVDWDVHHGNSTQQLFYTDPRVLYISLHRHDNGNFFPGTGAPGDCGIDKGVGYNVNIAFTGGLNPPMRDAEYLAAFRSLVMPIAREYNPEMVLVSAGFDAAEGHPAPLGGYCLSPSCFGHMTRELVGLAGGRLMLVLEGGYIHDVTSAAVETCLATLLGDQVAAVSEEEIHRKPCAAALETFEKTIQCQASYWPVVTRHQHLMGLSEFEARRLDRDEADQADTVTAFASLSVVTGDQNASTAAMTTTTTHQEQPMEES